MFFFFINLCTQEKPYHKKLLKKIINSFVVTEKEEYNKENLSDLEFQCVVCSEGFYKKKYIQQMIIFIVLDLLIYVGIGAIKNKHFFMFLQKTHGALKIALVGVFCVYILTVTGCGIFGLIYIGFFLCLVFLFKTQVNKKNSEKASIFVFSFLIFYNPCLFFWLFNFCSNIYIALFLLFFSSSLSAFLLTFILLQNPTIKEIFG